MTTRSATARSGQREPSIRDTVAEIVRLQSRARARLKSYDFSYGAFIAALVLLIAPGCGYRLGGAYAPEVHTVHVPTFTNDTFRRGVELQLTEAVQKRIQDHTPYRLAQPYEADTRLVGRIIDIRKRVVNQNQYDDPRELEFQLAIEVRWEDARSGQVLATRDIPLDPNAAHLVANPSFAPETGQSLASATQDAVDDLAREIVGMMEATW